MLGGLWKRRGERRVARRHELETSPAEVRHRVAAVVRGVVGPLEQAGAVRVEVGAEAESLMRLVPDRDDATAVEIVAGEDWITLTLGAGYDHEILVDSTYEWEWHLRSCIEAVVEGRYREVFVPGASSRVSSSRGGTEPRGFFEPDRGRRSFSMIFELPDENLDLVETYYGPLEGIGGAPTRRRAAIPALWKRAGRFRTRWRVSRGRRV